MKPVFSKELIERCDIETYEYFIETYYIFEMYVNSVNDGKVPAAYKWCDDYALYLGTRMNREGIGLKNIPVVWRQSKKFAEGKIFELLDETRFVLDCHKYIYEGSFYTDEELKAEILSQWETFLREEALKADEEMKDICANELPRIVLKKPAICPKCGHKVAKSIYGEPTPELIEAEERGKVFLAGCLVGPHNPEWGCPHCRQTFIKRW